MSSEVTLSKENYETVVADPDKIVLVDFWADWCQPCKAMEPVLAQLAQERTDVVLGKLNIEEEPDITQAEGIVSIPTLLFYKGGKVVKKQVGAAPRKVLDNLLAEISG